MAIKNHNFLDQGVNLMTLHILESLNRHPKIIFHFYFTSKNESSKKLPWPKILPLVSQPRQQHTKL